MEKTEHEMKTKRRISLIKYLNLYYSAPSILADLNNIIFNI